MLIEEMGKHKSFSKIKSLLSNSTNRYFILLSFLQNHKDSIKKVLFNARMHFLFIILLQKQLNLIGRTEERKRKNRKMN